MPPKAEVEDASAQLEELRRALSPQLQERLRSSLRAERQQLVLTTLHHRVRAIQASIASAGGAAAEPAPTIRDLHSRSTRELIEKLEPGVLASLERQKTLQARFEKSQSDDRDAKRIALAITVGLAAACVAAAMWLSEGHNLYRALRGFYGVYRWFLPQSDRRSWAEDVGTESGRDPAEYDLYT